MEPLKFGWEDVEREFVNNLGETLTLLAIQGTGRHQVIAYVYSDEMDKSLRDATVLVRLANLTVGWTRK